MADNNKRSYIEEIRNDQKLQGLVAQALGVKDESDFAIKVSDDWAKENKYEDNASDTLRHIILGGLMQSVPGEGIGRIGKGIAGKLVNLREVTNKESLIDTANNDFGRVLRQQLVDKENTSVENFVDAAKNVVTNLLNNKRIEVEGLSPELSTAGQRPRLSPGSLGGKSTKFQKGGANMANTEELYDDMGAQMELAGLVSEPTDKDPVSGNDIPLGATAEGVRDDETAAISPGEFVIPDYAVRYHGIDFYVESLQTAQQGLQQMEGMGLVGNPDDQTIPDEAPLPVMSDATGNEEMLDTGEPAEQEFQTGGLTTTTLPQAPQQGGLTTTALPQVPQQQVISQPPPLTQPLRPTTTQPVPVSPTFGQLQPQALTYRASQGPTAGLPGGYSVEEFIDDAGNKIFLTEIGGKVTEGVPSGFRRAKGRDGSIGLPGTITPIQPKSSFELPEIGSVASAAGTALGALSVFNTANKLSGGAIGTALKDVLKASPGGGGILEAIETAGGNVGDFVSGAISDFTSRISQGLGLTSAPALPQVTGGLSGGSGLTGQGLTAGLDKLASQRLGSQAATAAADAAAGSPGAFAPQVAGGLQSIPALQAAATAAQAAPAIGPTAAAAYGNLPATAALSGAPGFGAAIPAAATTGIEAATFGTVGNVGAGAGAAGAAGAATLGSWLGTIAPPMAAIMAIPTISNMLNKRSSNRLQAALQAGSKVHELLLNPDFNENNAARIRALTNLKGDKGQYGDIPSEGQVSSIGGALNRLEQAGGIDAIPSAAGKEMYKLLKAEIKIRNLRMKRESLGVSAEDQEHYAKLSDEEVEYLFDNRDVGSGGP